MKRYLLFFLFLLATASALAQKGLHIHRFLEAPKESKDQVNLVRITDSDLLRKYQLKLFLSAAYQQPSPEELQAIEQAVRRDAQQAANREEGFKQGRLYYGFYALPPLRRGENRYIFYRNDRLRTKDSGQLTLIYMTGAASIEQLKRTFGQK